MENPTSATAVIECSTWLCSAEIQAALIGAGAAIFIGTIGFLMVAWQIKAQARKSLYVDVYKQFLEALKLARDNESAFREIVSRFKWDLELHASMSDAQLRWPTAQISHDELRARYSDLTASFIGIMATVERWQIINPQLSIFSTAISDALENIQSAWTPYYQSILPVIPRSPDMDWRSPSKDTREKIINLSERLSDRLFDVVGYIVDIQVELQRLLLGGLFPHEVKRRTGVGEGVVVLRLDRYDALETLFVQRRSEREAARKSGGIS